MYKQTETETVNWPDLDKICQFNTLTCLSSVVLYSMLLLYWTPSSSDVRHIFILSLQCSSLSWDMMQWRDKNNNCEESMKMKMKKNWRRRRRRLAADSKRTKKEWPLRFMGWEIANCNVMEMMLDSILSFFFVTFTSFLWNYVFYALWNNGQLWKWNSASKGF